MPGQGLGAGRTSLMRTACVALVLSMMATVLFTACGDDSGSGQTAGTESSAAQGAPPPIDPTAPMSEQLARVFPVPKPGPESLPGAAAAIEAGREACKGKTPLQVREEFIGATQDLSDGQEAMIGELQKYEKQAVSPNFVAGQLAAGVYEATLPETKAMAGYQGCVYELALQLRRELAKKQG
jgi:hypothetical protein